VIIITEAFFAPWHAV